MKKKDRKRTIERREKEIAEGAAEAKAAALL